MNVIYRHGYSPDLDLGHFLDINIRIANNGSLYVDTPLTRMYFTDKFIEGGNLILLCPENF